MTAAMKDRPDFIPKIEYISIDLLEPNEGQYSKIDEETNRQVGLGRNPRWIRDKRYEALKKSITDDPEYLLYNPLEVFTLSHIKGKDGKYIVVGGNQRLQACKDLGFTEVPCVVFLPDTPFEKLRAYAIKSNESYGQNDYDILANGEWNTDELTEWGMELDYIAPGEGDNWDDMEDPDAGGKEDGEVVVDEGYSTKVNIPQYEPTGKTPTFEEMYDTRKMDELIEVINHANVDEETRAFLIEAAHRHARFNYKNIAEFYANATPEVQELMEESALVIIDINDAIAKGFTKLEKEIRENEAEAEEGEEE